MEITVYGQLRSATGEKTVELDAGGGTVGDAIASFIESYPRARRHLFDDGALRGSVRVLRDGERVELDADCPADARLQVFPAMQGG